MATGVPPPVYRKTSEWANTGTQEIMVFHPTMSEFADFPRYIEKIERENAHLSSGICKIIPPPEWTPRPSRGSDYSDVDNYIIDEPVKETIEGSNGIFIKMNKLYKRSMTVADFKKLATAKEHRNPKPELSLVDLERHYWRNITHGEPIYGADSTGSLTELEVDQFNMNRLGTILDLLKEKDIKIHGVNTVFLYFGMWKTTFPWHDEDMDLYSINYLHYGDPKFWYAVPPTAAEKFERLASQQFSTEGIPICKAFLRHKVYILSPSILRRNNVPYGTMVQYPGEFIVTFPKGYHMGFNTGYNCAESTNFAIDRWIDFGKNCTLCYCRTDGVEIDMRPFMEKYRQEEFEQWNEYWYGKRFGITDDDERKASKKKQKSSTQTKGRGRKKGSTSKAADIYAEREKQLKRAKKLVRNLWSRQSLDFFSEREYNERMGKLYPHCALCQYFLPKMMWAGETQPIGNRSETRRPDSSRRYITDQLFFPTDQDQGFARKQGNLFDNTADEPLLECSSCRVVVHRRCYPQEEYRNDDSAASEWKCNRCRVVDCTSSADMTAIASTSCFLCELRGGALVAVHSSSYIPDSFVHVICAIANGRVEWAEPSMRRLPISPPPECLLPPLSPTADGQQQLVKEENSLSKYKYDPESSPSTSAAPYVQMCKPNSPCSSPQVALLAQQQLQQLHQPPRRHASKYECELCSLQAPSDNLVQCHVCVTNEEEGASLYYHVTCAALAGMNFELRHSPPIICICSFHNSTTMSTYEPDTTVALNDRVVVKLDMGEQEDDKNGLHSEGSSKCVVRRGRVVEVREGVHCTVDFLDGSTSTDTYPCHVKRCECQRYGCKGNHIPGFMVYVKWSDDLLWEGYYRGKGPGKKYTVELEHDYTNGGSDADEVRQKPLNSDEERIVEVGRDNIYPLSDPLPKEVRNALLKRNTQHD